MNHFLEFDRDLLRKYDVAGPRYTSYPTAIEFSDDFNEAAYRTVAAASNEDPLPRVLSLYVHIPFCRVVCFYCACNRIITANRERSAAYLRRLKREAERQAALFDRDRIVEQLHFGGGTPTFLDEDELDELMTALGAAFPLARGAGREFSIEIDPRTVSESKIALLGELGFNRMSLGVQDFDPDVQIAVNRIQSVEQTEAALAAGRAAGFTSTNLDLIYGLPRQTPERFDRTLDTVLGMRPERIAIYNYAHMPHRFKVQRQIRAAELPDAETKLTLLEQAIERLTAAGYVYVGMDHFALPDDELAVAQRRGELHRNFQGYSTRAQLDLIGLGMSSIGHVGTSYIQNLKDETTYAAAIDHGDLAVARGLTPSADDLIRADVIGQIMCDHRLEFARIEQDHHLVFRQYFRDELRRLQRLEADGLVEVGSRQVSVTPRGRLLLRNVAMVFDAYRQQPADDNVRRFSRVL